MAEHEHLAAAAEKMGLPEALTLRSAEAKAKAQGVTVDELLAEWAGVSAGSPAPAPAPEPEPEAAEPAAAEPETVPAEVVEAEVTEVVDDEDLEPLVVEVEYLPTPATVSVEEALDWDQVTTVRTAGLTEKTSVSVPTWLVAVFVLIPLVALFWISFNTEGFACGEGGQLAVDWAGNLADCEGNAFEPGGGGGGELTAVFAEGAQVYAANCASCHGDGGGGGVGPAMSGGAVAETFPACSDHHMWVELGSNGWPDGQYGAQGKPVAGGMPGFASTLTPEQLTAAVLFERVQFGQVPLEEAGPDCGIASGDGGSGGEASAELSAAFAAGQEYYTNCASCHGDAGGGGVGPAMNNGAVLATFPACSDQIEWVTLGSTGWPDGTYGANGTPVAGGMPGYGTQTDAETIANVVLFERVQFGGQSLTEAGADCGLSAPATDGGTDEGDTEGDGEGDGTDG